MSSSSSHTTGLRCSIGKAVYCWQNEDCCSGCRVTIQQSQPQTVLQNSLDMPHPQLFSCWREGFTAVRTYVQRAGQGQNLLMMMMMIAYSTRHSCPNSGSGAIASDELRFGSTKSRGWRMSSFFCSITKKVGHAPPTEYFSSSRHTTSPCGATRAQKEKLQVAHVQPFL